MLATWGSAQGVGGGLALVTYKPAAHVMAVLRGSTQEGGVCFRKYDNDGEARQSGTYELVTADELGLTRDCQMQAVVVSGSPIHISVSAEWQRPMHCESGESLALPMDLRFDSD